MLSLCYFSHFTGGEKKKKDLSLRKVLMIFPLAGQEKNQEQIPIFIAFGLRHFLFYWCSLSSLLISTWGFFFNCTNTTSYLSCFVQGIAYSQYCSCSRYRALQCAKKQPNTVPAWGARAAATQDTALPLESLSNSKITSRERDFRLSVLLGL